MEKKTIRSGMPFVLAGAGVLLYALVLGIGSIPSYFLAAVVGIAGFFLGRFLFPDQVIFVEKEPDTGNPEVDALIREAKRQLDAIAEANVIIEDPAMSAQIDDIEGTCREIVARLEEQPSLDNQLRTFLRYYLPTTLKLLQSRAKMEAEIQAGKNGNINGRIAMALSAVQAAFHKQLNAIDEFRFIDLESEMDALREMLAGDGLGQDAASAQAQPSEEDPFAGLFAQEGK